MAKPPNIVFLFTDDQRYDTLAALGNPDIRTPTLDRLAASGVTFTHAHIQGSTVPAVCVCSRACLLTGRSLFHVPRNIGPDLALCPEELRKAGYETFATGKWHNGGASLARGFTGGDRIYLGGMSNHWRVPIHDFRPDGTYSRADAEIGKQHSSELFTDAAVRFLERYEGEKPFFLYLPYTAPHDPRTPPPRFEKMYDPAAIPVPRSFMPRHPFDNGEMTIRDEKLLPWPRTKEAVQAEIAAYYGMITHADEQMGRVLAALEASGHDRDTIVLFAGDNGLAVGRHGLLGKQNLYDHSLRVPLIVRAPGAGKPGTRSDALVYLHDLFPTVCDLVGVPVPATVEGTSLAPVLKGETAGVRDAIFAAYRGVQRCVRTQRWKLIWYPAVGRTQLFDLDADPDELDDLAGRTEYAATRADLASGLAAWQETLRDEAPRVAGG